VPLTEELLIAFEFFDHRQKTGMLTTELLELRRIGDGPGQAEIVLNPFVPLTKRFQRTHQVHIVSIKIESNPLGNRGLLVFRIG